MFYILCVVGGILIAVGIYNDKTQIGNSIVDNLMESKKTEEIEDLKIRVSNLEKIVYYDIPELDEEDQPIRNSDDIEGKDELISYESIAEEANSQMDIPIDSKESLISSSLGLEKFNLLCQYEKEDRSIEEICTLLNMNKGEVLLLKGLYKNYQI